VKERERRAVRDIPGGLARASKGWLSINLTEQSRFGAYGKAAPPEKLTQEAFEGNDRHLRRLLRIKTGERPDVQDLWEYLQDPRHTEIQGSLLAYLLPFCLELWCEDYAALATSTADLWSISIQFWLTARSSTSI